MLPGGQGGNVVVVQRGLYMMHFLVDGLGAWKGGPLLPACDVGRATGGLRLMPPKGRLLGWWSLRADASFALVAGIDLQYICQCRCAPAASGALH